MKLHQWLRDDGTVVRQWVSEDWDVWCDPAKPDEIEVFAASDYGPGDVGKALLTRAEAFALAQALLAATGDGANL